MSTNISSISSILNQIDSGEISLPTFQRGYVWTKNQVKSFFDSLYNKYPVGSFLVWNTDANYAVQPGKSNNESDKTKFILDGQQRITTLYGVCRGKPPKFFDSSGKEKSFTDLYFHLIDEEFEFYNATKMRKDSLWIDISALLTDEESGISKIIRKIPDSPEKERDYIEYVRRLERICGIMSTDLHVEVISSKNLDLDTVVEIFNRINSRGTKLSTGDLAMAEICAKWPEARENMKDKLGEWKSKGYDFKMDFLLRCVNSVVNNRAHFKNFRRNPPEDIQKGLKRTSRHIDTSLNMISQRLGLDCEKILNGHHFGIPVMVNYINNKKGKIDTKSRDKLLFWFAQAGMRGRYMGQIETNIDQDINALKNGGLDSLLENLRPWGENLQVRPEHFIGRNPRFFRIFYMITRMSKALDWGTGLSLKADLVGKMNSLESHHIFPQSRLKSIHERDEINELANLCLATKDTNLKIGNRLPESYFPEIEELHDGALKSQWIPSDESLWKVENYKDFLVERRALIAEEVNKCFEDLLNGDNKWLSGAQEDPASESIISIKTTTSAENVEEREIEKLNSWIVKQGLPSGEIEFDCAHPETGEQMAVIDLAWPEGLQPNLSEPVALLLNATVDIIAHASRAGFKCFTKVSDLREHIKTDILKDKS